MTYFYPHTQKKNFIAYWVSNSEQNLQKIQKANGTQKPR